jgi:hypothetical protein
MKLGSLLKGCQTEGDCVCALSVACSTEEWSHRQLQDFTALSSILVVGQYANGQCANCYYVCLTIPSHHGHKKQSIKNLTCVRYKSQEFQKTNERYMVLLKGVCSKNIFKNFPGQC